MLKYRAIYKPGPVVDLPGKCPLFRTEFAVRGTNDSMDEATAPSGVF